MERIQFTIAPMLIVALIVAVGFTALSESSDLWNSGLFAVPLGVLLVADQPTYPASAGDLPLLSRMPQLVHEVTPIR